MSVLSAVRRGAILLGFAPPAAIVSATDPGSRQMLELARLDAEGLAARIDWDALTAQHSFTAVDGVAQPDGRPTDFARFTFGGEVWNGTLNGPIAGPTSSSTWASASAWQNPSIVQRFRIFGGQFQMLGARAGDAISYPYITTKLYADKDGASKAEITADDDAFRVPEQLIVLGLVWRWKQTKGFDYAEDMRSAELEIERASSADGGGIGVVSFASQPFFDDIPASYPGVLGP